MESYIGSRLSSLGPTAPHAYAMAEEALQQLCESQADVIAVVLTGESGAGKSRQAAQLLDFWCWRVGGAATVSPCLSAATTLFAALGCAPTCTL